MKLFKTFFIGGYECADMINNRRQRVDLLHLTGHDEHVEEDYALLAAAGIKTVREGIRWSVVGKEPFSYHFSEVKNRILAAQKFGIQQLWDICHFGFPDDLPPTHPKFTERFAGMCKAFTELYRHCTDDPLIVVPINEISFLSYLGGDVAGTVPFKRKAGKVIKYHLCEAAIKGIEAIKTLDPAAQIMLVEPLIRIHPREGRQMTKRIREYNKGQFEAMDIITGRMHPEMGGHPDYMDLAGFNYYYQNQWEHRGRMLCWKADREQRDFPGLLKIAADRYSKPVVISETGHFKEDRALWMQQITEECITAMKKGVDLRGICIYPVLDRPDWDSMEYINCGVWGYHEKTKERFTEDWYLATVKACIMQMETHLNPIAIPAMQPVA
jgi:beta-glucosidase/6-phospho-beta-glucosidase/beta-galactosidase